MENMDFLTKIKDKFNVELTKTQAEEFVKELAEEIGFGSCMIEKELVRLLMALHSIDNDEDCIEFYYDVQERYDDLIMQDGREPIKDRVFANCMTNLIQSGHVEEIKTLDYQTNRVIRGHRINHDFKIKIHNTMTDKINKYKQNQQLN